MYVSIHSVDAENDEGRFTNNGNKFEIRVDTSELEFLNFVSELSIRAEESETAGTGERGGEIKTTNRRLVIALNKEDLAKIVEEAIKGERKIFSVN
jgi:hypothetical protein